MRQNNIETLIPEAQRLLNFTLECYRELKDKPDMLNERDGSNFPVRKIEEKIKTLEDELKKLTQQEMVLAVVGTVKSGKSTTINAIVGKEVLPNRNLPMTALPTRICHTQGQSEPVLHVRNTPAVNKLISGLKKALSDNNKYKYQGADMPGLIEKIEKGFSLKEQYKGAENIFLCLKYLNDLVRLSEALEVDFPFEEFTTVDTIPTINVEFSHLTGLQEGYGQLTLLDTPGPNEAGEIQEHFEDMLKEQLRKASAILMVMDYTQMTSTSDADIRKVVSTEGDSVPIYVLVNKFDQNDTKSQTAEQIEDFVSGELMKNSVPANRVFPVSSKWGYLANRARHELHLYGKLPTVDISEKENTSDDNATAGWVKEFADVALGAMWDEGDVQDHQRMIKVADGLWKKSLFEKPLRDIIQRAYSRAALFSLVSACNKLVSYSEEIYEYTRLQYEALTKEVKSLQDNVEELSDYIASAFSVRDDVNDEIKEIRSVIDSYIKKESENLKGEIGQEIEDYFNKVIECLSEQEKNCPDKSRDGEVNKNNSLAKFVGVLKIYLQKRIVKKSGENRMVFNNKDKAKEFINETEIYVINLLNLAKKELSDNLAEKLQSSENSLMELIRGGINPLEEKIQETLASSGFSIKLRFPEFNADELSFSTDYTFEQEIKKVGKRRRKDGVWGAICEFFDSSDWGWESYDTTEKSYAVSLTDLKNSIQKQCSGMVDCVLTATEDKIKLSEDELTRFFDNFADILKSIQADFQQSITMLQQESEPLKLLQQNFYYFSKKSRTINSDSMALQKEVNTLEKDV